MTTFYSYGEVQIQRQAEILQQLQKPRTENGQDISALAKALAQEMQRNI